MNAYPLLTLGAACELITDGSHFSPTIATEGYPYVTVRDVNNGSIDIGQCARISSEAFAQLAANGCQPRKGDVLFSKDGSIGRVAVVRDDRPFVVLSSLAILRPSQRLLLPEYLAHVLCGPAAQSQAHGSQSGTAIRRVVLRSLREIRIPVPPIEEQRRIVDILEDHLSRLDAAAASLNAAGRRSDLLRSVTLNSLAPNDSSAITLGQLSIDSGYGTSTKCVVDGPGVPVVRIPNLVAGRIDLADEKRAADPLIDLTRLMLAKDDLLIIRTNGSRDLIGRAAVVQPEIHASFASYLIRFKVDTSRARPQWVRVMLGAPNQRRVLEAMAASSAGQYNLGLKKLNGVPIPCPPLENQDELLARVDEQKCAQKSLAGSLDIATARCQALRRSLLAAAFSGRLTGGSSDMEMVEEMAGV